MLYKDLGYEPDDLDVQVSELLVATADGSDELIDDSVGEVLSLLRERMKMDVVFVSEFTNGQRVFRRVDALPAHQVISAGEGGPLEESWCQRVVDGRLPERIQDASKFEPTAELLANMPFPVGTFLSTPIVLKNGNVYGTLCCFSFSPVDDPDPNDLKRLKYTAQMTAEKIDRKQTHS